MDIYTSYKLCKADGKIDALANDGISTTVDGKVDGTLRSLLLVLILVSTESLLGSRTYL